MDQTLEHKRIPDLVQLLLQFLELHLLLGDLLLEILRFPAYEPDVLDHLQLFLVHVDGQPPLIHPPQFVSLRIIRVLNFIGENLNVFQLPQAGPEFPIQLPHSVFQLQQRVRVVLLQCPALGYFEANDMDVLGYRRLKAC